MRERCRDEVWDDIFYVLLVKELMFINYNEFCDKEYLCLFLFFFIYFIKKGGERKWVFMEVMVMGMDMD